MQTNIFKQAKWEIFILFIIFIDVNISMNVLKSLICNSQLKLVDERYTLIGRVERVMLGRLIFMVKKKNAAVLGSLGAWRT